MINQFLFNMSFYSQDLYYFASSLAAQFSFFYIRMMQETSKGKIGNDKQLGMTDYNIFLKNNLNRFVTMNVTQNFHIWHLTKVNH